MAAAARNIGEELAVLELPDGATARRVGSALELRDASGGLLIRYRDGCAEVHAPRGDVTFEAAGDVVLRAGAELRLEASQRVHVTAPEGEIALTRVRFVAEQVATAVTAVAHRVEQYELEAGRVVERARDVFRDVQGLVQSRFGRARTVVEESHTLHAKRHVIVSQRETTIDGERILIG